ncbi:MAG: 30S ribosomal protein S16 [Bacillota bacterium]|nr:30S ribosomal protein S16 [Bacillota bacterium]
MMVKIRFRRMGAKKKPFYRIVVGDSRRHPSKGNFIEELGYYNPLRKEEVKIDEEKVKKWLANGAQVSDSVKELFVKHNIL